MFFWYDTCSLKKGTHLLRLLKYFTEEVAKCQGFVSENIRKKGSVGVPGGLVVRIQSFRCHGTGSISAWETEIPQALWQSPPKKKGTGWNYKRNSIVIS